jgi:hypothetical protein
MGGFKSWDDYRLYAERVRRNRYIHTHDVSEFLEAVRESARGREIELEKGWKFFRAQRGCSRKNGDLKPYPSTRMRPRADKATEGRVNPKGNPCLYGATDPATAVAEVRPRVEEIVSVALFRLSRNIKLVEFLTYHAESGFSSLLQQHFDQPEPTHAPEYVEKDVWTHIDKAFSEPVSRSDDRADYVPTQVIAEALKNGGYDGILYKSRLSLEGVNVALFDPRHARITARPCLHIVSDVKVSRVPSSRLLSGGP